MRTRPGDQPRAGLEGHVGPQPVKDHDQSVPEADQERHVHGAPQQPGERALDSDPAKVSDGGAAFGLAFTLPEDLREVYRSFGNDLAQKNGDPSWQLPVPARFVIDAKGIVRSVEADPDYRYRPNPR